MTVLDDRLVPVFAQQHWLVSLADVHAAGGTTQEAHDRLQRRTWERVDRRVYRLVGAPVTWEQRLLAPILTAPPGIIVASDLAGAALHGIPGYGRGAPELTTRRPYNLRRPGMRIRSSNDLDRCTIVSRSGVPVTDISRTLLDLGRTVGDARLLRGIEWARRSGQTDWAQLIATLAVHARRGRGGIRRLRRVIAAHAHREEITDSDFELLVLALLAEHGLPEPVLHHRVHDRAGRFVAEVDLAYPHRRIAIEADGPAHLGEEVHERDLPRQNHLVLQGWTVLRFTWKRYTTRPELLVADVRAALRVAPGEAA
jgi:very-short-patch-repair endonuclease